ncbi:MAG: SDR family oxidoreductase [Planctomycetia bacterium]|nr:SDR family oxidoreductase [Planctomycetia bacterium]
MKNQNIFITGATGGIGAAVARRFNQTKNRLFLHGFMNRQKMDSLLNALLTEEEIFSETERNNKKQETRIFHGFFDLSDVSQQNALCEMAWNSLPGGVDVLIQCAGIDILTPPAKFFTYEEKLEKMLAVDVVASMRIARNIASRMMASKKKGVIINFGWDAVQRGIAGDSAELFAVTKGGIMAFTKSLAQKIAPDIRVNCVAPGWICTEWGERAPENWNKYVMADSLLQRWGTAEEVADVVFFLTSEAGKYINAQIIEVNGGVNTKMK